MDQRQTKQAVRPLNRLATLAWAQAVRAERLAREVQWLRACLRDLQRLPHGMLLLLATLAWSGCGGSEDHLGPLYVTLANHPSGFIAQENRLCYAPHGQPWPDTCGWPGLYRVRDASGEYTYCPPPRLRTVLACDGAGGRARPYCVE